jgi:high-affinity Fe2+/Pb2+ permease
VIFRKRSSVDEMAAMRRRAGPALAFGTSFAAGMAVFAMGGNWLGRKYGHETAYTLVGVALGFVYGGYEMWKLVQRANQQIAEQDAAVAAQDHPEAD